MKNKLFVACIVTTIVAIFVIVLMLFGNNNTEHDPASASSDNQGLNITDALRFKLDYESLNDEPQHTNLYVPENNRIVYLSFDELMNFIESGTGVFLFSRPECPSCRALIPTLLQVAADAQMNIHYYNITFDRDEHNENYVRILEALHSYLPVDTQNQSPEDEDFDESIKRVTVPHLFFVVDGQIISETMMNRHQLIEDEDFDGIYEYLMEKFLPVQQVLQSRRSACQEC